VLPSDLTDKHVLIVEDIVDTGNTLNHLLALVKEQNPLSVRTVALLDKPSARRLPVFADYVGFEIGPQFVVGYGLDVDGRYRNLPYVAEVVLD
jgi:hypoxanthine phosphoribosyltransferase